MSLNIHHHPTLQVYLREYPPRPCSHDGNRQVPGSSLVPQHVPPSRTPLQQVRNLIHSNSGIARLQVVYIAKDSRRCPPTLSALRHLKCRQTSLYSQANRQRQHRIQHNTLRHTSSLQNFLQILEA